MTSRSLHALAAGLVDYAGLFPPAALDMRQAAEQYAAYRSSPESWMLGRFVAPVAKLDELAAEAVRLGADHVSPWRVAAIGGADPVADADALRRVNASRRGILVDVVEHRTATAEAVRAAARATPAGVTLYAEIPLADEPRPLLAEVKSAGVRAKARTGGLTPDVFPTPPQLARFIHACAALDVPFKATAGLHHPVRGEFPLTYVTDAPRGTMFGFLNVFAAGAFARTGMDEPTLARLLDEREAGAFEFAEDSLTWRGHRLALDQLVDARASLAIAFGSCSFREPVEDLQQLALLHS